MTSSPASRRRLHIARLELDLRGIAPATADAVAHALGAALAQALTATPASTLASAGRLDAGRVASSAAPDPGELATRIAGQVAATVRREQT